MTWQQPLLNWVDAFENILGHNNTIAAKNKLVFDIRDKIEKWIVDYEPDNSLQLSKAELLELIDELIRRLGSQ